MLDSPLEKDVTIELYGDSVPTYDQLFQSHLPGDHSGPILLPKTICEY